MRVLIVYANRHRMLAPPPVERLRSLKSKPAYGPRTMAGVSARYASGKVAAWAR